MKLKFSFLVILTFVIVGIFSLSCCYGYYFNTYGAEGREWHAIIVALGLLISSLGATFLKKTSKYFQRCRIIEYLLIIFFCVFLLYHGLHSFSSYVNVTLNKDKIQPTLINYINKSKKLFEDYDSYVKKRKENSIDYMSSLIKNRSSNCTDLKKHGFENLDCYYDSYKVFENQQQTNIEILLGELSVNNNYEWLKECRESVKSWDAKAIVDFSKALPDSIKSWNRARTQYNNKKYVFENEVDKFSKTINEDSLDKIEIMITGKSLNPLIFGIIIILGLLMLLPYFLSKRNSKAEGLDFWGNYKPDEYEVIL